MAEGVLTCYLLVDSYCTVHTGKGVGGSISEVRWLFEMRDLHAMGWAVE